MFHPKATHDRRVLHESWQPLSWGSLQQVMFLLNEGGNSRICRHCAFLVSDSAWFIESATFVACESLLNQHAPGLRQLCDHVWDRTVNMRTLGDFSKPESCLNSAQD